MLTATVPASFDELTPAWLTGVLREAGVLVGAGVTGCEEIPTEGGSGFASDVRRLRLRYDVVEDAAPRTLIAKLPAAPGDVRSAGWLFGGYPRELGFYATAPADLGVGVPHCFASMSDRSRGRMVLLLEDVEADGADSAAGADLETARRVVDGLASMHARWWAHPDLYDASWVAPLGAEPRSLPRRIASRVRRMARLTPAGGGGVDLEASWSRLAREHPRYAAGAAAPVIRELPRVRETVEQRLSEAPVTLTHGDLRLDNVRSLGGGGRPLVLIDWQRVSASRGAHDLGYFLALESHAEVWSDLDALLAEYQSGLRAHGVPSGAQSSVARLRDEIGYGALLALGVVVAAFGNGLFRNEDGRATMMRSMERLEQAAVALDLERLVASID